MDLSIKKMNKCQFPKGYGPSAVLLRDLLLSHIRARDKASVHTKDLISVNIKISVYSSLKKAF